MDGKFEEVIIFLRQNLFSEISRRWGGIVTVTPWDMITSHSHGIARNIIRANSYNCLWMVAPLECIGTTT